MLEQESFDVSGAPRPWLGQRLWNRLGTWLYRRRHPFTRAICCGY
jgi:hypothetical protein